MIQADLIEVQYPFRQGVMFLLIKPLGC